MSTVIEQPHHAPVPSLVSGSVVRHLVDDGADHTACDLPVSAQAQEVAVPWRRASDRCPACAQAQGID